MILVVLWDGLRPDLITRETTPFLWEQAHSGVLGTANHAVFPSATRLSSASLTTGCYPGRHGIVGNSLYVPAVDPDTPGKCSEWQFLQSIAKSDPLGLLHVPTVSETLRQAGKKVAFCGSGSTGTSFLSNPLQTTPVVNWAAAWPAPVAEVVQRRFGGFLSPDSTVLDRSRHVLRIAKEYLLPEYHPDLLTVWLAEPDSTQHAHGLGSPEATGVLREVDDLFRDLWTHLVKLTRGENLSCLFLSDHGFSTIDQAADPGQRLVCAGLKDSPSSTEVVVSAGNIHLTTAESRGRCGDILQFLMAEPWVGGLFVREDLADRLPDIPTQCVVRSGTHPRSSEITFTYRWSDKKNRYGVPGCAAASSSRAATHGSASPYDINNSLAAWGDGIKTGLTSPVPTGIVDIAPTVLHLLGVDGGAAMDGRVLEELLEGGTDPRSVETKRDLNEHMLRTRSETFRQVEHFSEALGSRYLDRVDYG